MNRGRLLAIRQMCALITACAMLLVALTANTRAAGPSMSQRGKAQKSDKSKPVSRIDEGYTKKIEEYTTEKYFSTELVNYLPASDKVPSPEKVLGYIAGTPEKLTYTKDMYRYYRELERTTPRVRVFIAPERSEEGKEQMLVLVSDESNLARLDRYKDL